MSPDLKLWTRETYSMLDFIGDLGGLYDALCVIGSVLVGPYGLVSLQSSFLASIFRQSAKNEAKGVEQQRTRFSMEDSDARIMRKSCPAIYLVGCCYMRSKVKRYKRLMSKS